MREKMWKYWLSYSVIKWEIIKIFDIQSMLIENVYKKMKMENYWNMKYDGICKLIILFVKIL